MMFVRVLSLSIFVMGCAALALHSPALSQNPADDPTVNVAEKPYLGLHVAAVPPVVSLHLPEVLGADTGMLVFAVDPNSPAAEAGLKSNDILVRFDGQNVSSDSDLLALMNEVEIGQAVELNLIRHGKPLVVHVTLVKRPANMGFDQPLGAWPQMQNPGMPDFAAPDFGEMPAGLADMQAQMERMQQWHKKVHKMHQEFHKGLGGMPAMPEMPAIPEMPAMPKMPAMPGMPDFDPDDFSSWMQSASSSNFSQISINKIGDDQYHAIVKYKANDGETRELNMEGTLDEIRNAAEADPDMPVSVRRQVEQSLKLRSFTPFQNDQWRGNMQKMQDMMKQFNQDLQAEEIDLPKLPSAKLQSL